MLFYDIYISIIYTCCNKKTTAVQPTNTSSDITNADEGERERERERRRESEKERKYGIFIFI